MLRIPYSANLEGFGPTPAIISLIARLLSVECGTPTLDAEFAAVQSWLEARARLGDRLSVFTPPTPPSDETKPLFPPYMPGGSDTYYTKFEYLLNLLYRGETDTATKWLSSDVSGLAWLAPSLHLSEPALSSALAPYFGAIAESTVDESERAVFGLAIGDVSAATAVLSSVTTDRFCLALWLVLRARRTTIAAGGAGVTVGGIQFLSIRDCVDYVIQKLGDDNLTDEDYLISFVLSGRFVDLFNIDDTNITVGNEVEAVAAFVLDATRLNDNAELTLTSDLARAIFSPAAAAASAATLARRARRIAAAGADELAVAGTLLHCPPTAAADTAVFVAANTPASLIKLYAHMAPALPAPAALGMLACGAVAAARNDDQDTAARIAAFLAGQAANVGVVVALALVCEAVVQTLGAEEQGWGSVAVAAHNLGCIIDECDSKVSPALMEVYEKFMDVVCEITTAQASGHVLSARKTVSKLDEVLETVEEADEDADRILEVVINSGARGLARGLAAAPVPNWMHTTIKMLRKKLI